MPIHRSHGDNMEGSSKTSWKICAMKTLHIVTKILLHQNKFIIYLALSQNFLRYFVIFSSWIRLCLPLENDKWKATASLVQTMIILRVACHAAPLHGSTHSNLSIGIPYLPAQKMLKRDEGSRNQSIHIGHCKPLGHLNLCNPCTCRIPPPALRTTANLYLHLSR